MDDERYGQVIQLQGIHFSRVLFVDLVYHWQASMRTSNNASVLLLSNYIFFVSISTILAMHTCIDRLTPYFCLHACAGDQRSNVSAFLTEVGICRHEQIKVHGF
jgi:hypothetical protein